MKRLNNLRISSKLAVAFTILLVMVGIGGSVGLRNVWKMADIMDQDYRQLHFHIVDLSNIYAEVSDGRHNALLSHLTDDESLKKSLENRVHQSESKTQDLINVYIKHEQNPDEWAAISTFVNSPGGIQGCEGGKP